MSSQFHSGVFNRGLAAWHNEGTVINDDALTAQQAFEMADALFPVVKQPLFYRWQTPEGTPEARPSKRSCLIHGITGAELGTCGAGYEIVANDRLLEMAKAVEDQVIMDAVCVLDEGRRIAFTGLIRDTGGQVIPGDFISRFIVGYLGHDGATGIGSLYTDIRVVCANTLAIAMSSQNQRSLAHRPGVNREVTALINSIDVARRGFDDDLTVFQQFAETPMSPSEYQEMLRNVFAPELAKPVREGGKVLRKRTLSDLRVHNLLMQAPYKGQGVDIKGVMGTTWGYYNALTEVLTSQKLDAQNAIQRFNRSTFGVNQRRIQVANEFCREFCGIK